VLMKMELKTIFVLVFLAALASGNEGEKPNRHSELLKPETNSIDHGPTKHKSGHLLGHKGEHWSLLKKKRKNNKKKTNHSLDGSHHDNLDDIRLQDLSYNPRRKFKEPKVRYFFLQWKVDYPQFISLFLQFFRTSTKPDISKNFNITKPKWWAKKISPRLITRKSTENIPDCPNSK